MADQIDQFGAANFKSHTPYKRPWRDPGSRRVGRTTMSRAEVITILRAHGHQIEG